MKTLGMLGGLSWRSTVFYYEGINAAVEAALGAMHSARMAIWSFDLQSCLGAGVDWRADPAPFVDAARRLEAADADGLLIAANSVHLHADAVEQAIGIPLIHIGDAVAGAVTAEGFDHVGLIGIPATMEEDFYIGRLDRHHIRVTVPPAAQREAWGKVIYEDLFAGKTTPRAATLMQDTLAYFTRAGCQALVLCCTELRMLPWPGSDLRTFDSVALHVAAVTRFVLEDAQLEWPGS